MFVVRYPDGTAVTYNTAGYLAYKLANQAWELSTKDPDKGGKWIASIMLSSGATVEAVTACKVERPEGQVSLERLVTRVTKRLGEHRNHRGYIDWTLKPKLKHLKSLLGCCDMRGGRWR